MTPRPHCWLCGRSAAKWGPLIERGGTLAHAGCREDFDRVTAATVAAAPPPDRATLDRLAVLLEPEGGAS
jgi:hypothetical protein